MIHKEKMKNKNAPRERRVMILEAEMKNNLTFKDLGESLVPASVLSKIDAIKEENSGSEIKSDNWITNLENNQDSNIADENEFLLILQKRMS